MSDHEVELVGLRLSVPGEEPLVLLRELDGSQRVVAMWVGSTEALAIARGMEGAPFPRPLTHDVVINLLDLMGLELQTVRVTAVHDGVFLAQLVLSNGETLDARPSDGIALAVRCGAQITVAAEVLDTVGIRLTSGDVEDEDEVVAFREFLDDVSAADFDITDDGPQPPIER